MGLADDAAKHVKTNGSRCTVTLLIESNPHIMATDGHDFGGALERLAAGALPSTALLAAIKDAEDIEGPYPSDQALRRHVRRQCRCES